MRFTTRHDQLLIESPGEFFTVGPAVQDVLTLEHPLARRISREVNDCRNVKTGEFYPGVFHGDEAVLVLSSMQIVADRARRAGPQEANIRDLNVELLLRDAVEVEEIPSVQITRVPNEEIFEPAPPSL